MSNYYEGPVTEPWIATGKDGWRYIQRRNWHERNKETLEYELYFCTDHFDEAQEQALVDRLNALDAARAAIQLAGAVEVLDQRISGTGRDYLDTQWLVESMGMTEEDVFNLPGSLAGSILALAELLK